MPVQLPYTDAFPWPDQCAHAMPSVKSKWTGDIAPPARVYASKDAKDALKDHVSNTTELCATIYASLNTKSSDFLKSTLRRRVTDGIVPASTGSKDSLVKKIQASDK